jgi:hypothetical protein
MAAQTSFLAANARQYRRRQLAQTEQAEGRNGLQPVPDSRVSVPTSTRTARDESDRSAGAANINSLLRRRPS